MKLDLSIIALKDFENNYMIRLKLARYSTAYKAPSINASEQLIEIPGNISRRSTSSKILCPFTAWHSTFPDTFSFHSQNLYD